MTVEIITVDYLRNYENGNFASEKKGRPTKCMKNNMQRGNGNKTVE